MPTELCFQAENTHVVLKKLRSLPCSLLKCEKDSNLNKFYKTSHGIH